MIIYLTTNKIDGKIYIGKYCGTKLFYLGSGTYIKRAIKKYGKENFTRITLEDGITDHDYLCEREIYWIKKYDAMNPDIGYNLCVGGRGALGFKHSEESRKKMSEMRKGENNYNYGKHPSIETRAKISKNHADMSSKNNPMYGLKNENHPAYGRKHTKNELEKMSKALEGRTFTEEHKRNIINNHADMSGKNNPNITKKEVVLKILNMLDGTMFQKDIAKKLNISYRIVHKVKNNYYNNLYDIPIKKLEYKNRRGKNSPRYGIKHTKESIEKMSGKNGPMYGKKGKDNPKTIKENIVLKISKLLGDGISQSEISKKLNISRPTVAKVKNGGYDNIYSLSKKNYPTAITKGKNKSNIVKKDIVMKIKAMLGDNVSVKNIIKILGVSKSAVYRTKNKFYDSIYDL